MSCKVLHPLSATAATLLYACLLHINRFAALVLLLLAALLVLLLMA
jgi:hypothetical protein